jgi:hypothetical protein
MIMNYDRKNVFFFKKFDLFVFIVAMFVSIGEYIDPRVITHLNLITKIISIYLI